MNAVDLAGHAGISYRQLDLWTAAGHLRPLERKKASAGHPREYPPEEVQVAVGIAQLLRAGLTLQAAAKVARRGRSHVVAVWQALSQASEAAS